MKSNREKVVLIKKTKWLNLFKSIYKDKKGAIREWIFASRSKTPLTKTSPDAVSIIAFKDEKMVLIKQYRPSVNAYVIETIAGLVDSGMNSIKTAIQEVLEETGLDVVKIGKVVDYPFLYNSVGITNERVSFVFVKVQGEITNRYNEESEDIEVIVVDREAAKSLLHQESHISAKCWLILFSYAHGFDWWNFKEVF